ncbi:MAG: alkaline phosphatase family protein [Pirellulales bacterium]|nr:alkaline phosphatase family protein [Pirellulales bacterium]
MRIHRRLLRGAPAKRAVPALFLFAASLAVCGSAAESAERPRLIVVVSVDQLPQRYLEQFRSGFAKDGLFEQVFASGAWFTNCYHRHAFTITGPGHASLLTGTDPAVHGIVSNGWYHRGPGGTMGCVEDALAPLVGAPSLDKGVSPRNLLVPTLGDALKLATYGKAKVFGVAQKDRSAVLPAGHAADAAYWFDENSGNWVTSKYYRDDLPGYLRNLNESSAAEAYAGQSWELIAPTECYRRDLPDDNPYETNFPPLGRAFPHRMPAQADANYFKLLEATPFGNELTLAVARLLVEHEQLGGDNVPDLLCIGLSSNDYVGHAFGPHSLEVQDVTFRMDRDLGEFMRWLDERIGAGNWTFGLSSDHGVGPVPELAMALRLRGARNPLGDATQLAARLEKRLRNDLGIAASGKPLVARAEGVEIFLDHTQPELIGEKLFAARKIVRQALLEEPSVAIAYTQDELIAMPVGGEGLPELFRRTMHPKRSGDVLFAMVPYVLQGSKNTASHGTPWEYDRHVPLLFWGAGIKPGRYLELASPGCLGTTLARVLAVDPPAAASVGPLDSVLQSE